MSNTLPVFVMSRDLPDEPRIDNYDMCLAVSKTVGREGVLGAQKIGALWRIYLRNQQVRAALLANSLTIGGRTVTVLLQNPFVVRGPDGNELSGTRLTISDVPISVANMPIESALIKKGLKLRSAIKMEETRDREGNLTGWLSGRRFVYIDLPKTQVERLIEIGPFKAKLYYREMADANVCFSCQKPGHKALDCPSRRKKHDQHETGTNNHPTGNYQEEKSQENNMTEESQKKRLKSVRKQQTIKG